MRTVLFVVHGFPPMGGAGVQRVVKFIKHLGEFGWRSVVLTARLDERDMALPDPTLARDLPDDLAVHRSECPDPFQLYRRLGGSAKLGSAAFSSSKKSAGLSGTLARWMGELMVPDTKVMWVPGALADARKVFAQHRVDAIVSSSPWETVHLIASRLSRLHRVGWVADFRDPWTQASWNPRHPGALGRINFMMEGMTLRRADGVVVTSRTTGDGLVDSHHGLDGLRERIHVIYNGYDEADFEGVTAKRFDRFTIVYSGRAVMPGRTPEPLFAALARLIARRPELAAKVQVVFVGALSSEADDLVAKYRLSEVVRFAGYLPHREAVGYVCGADMLYLNTIPECIPGKFPEYLRAGRTILGVMPPDCEVAGLIRDWHAGVVVASEDEEGLARTIESRVEGAGGTSEPSPDVERLSRRRLTGQLAELLDRVSRRRPEGCVND